MHSVLRLFVSFYKLLFLPGYSYCGTLVLLNEQYFKK